MEPIIVHMAWTRSVPETMCSWKERGISARTVLVRIPDKSVPRKFPLCAGNEIADSSDRFLLFCDLDQPMFCLYILV